MLPICGATLPLKLWAIESMMTIVPASTKAVSIGFPVYIDHIYEAV